MTNRKAAWKPPSNATSSVDIVEERFPLATSARELEIQVQSRLERNAVTCTYCMGDGSWVMTSVVRRSK